MANEQSNPGCLRIALKMATGSGKTTVMAMLIAWRTANKLRTSSNLFSRGLPVVTKTTLLQLPKRAPDGLSPGVGDRPRTELAPSMAPFRVAAESG
jgi:type III restriction enzyme